MGQETLASTNQLLLKGFSCQFFRLLNQTVIYASAYDRMSSKNNITIITIDNSLYSC